MLSGRNLLYGLAASLVLFTIVMAIEQLYLREVDAVVAASHSPRDARPGVLRVRGASVPTEGPADIEAAPEDGTPDPGKSPRMSQRSGTPRSQSAVAPSWSQPIESNKQGSAVDEGWLNTVTATLAGALPFGGGGSAAPGPPVTPSEIPSADQMEVREILYSDSADTACVPGNRQFTLEDVRGLYVCVVWLGLAGTYAQQVTFESPDGHVYQTITSAFATAQGGATGGTLKFDERDYPVQAAGWGANGRVLVKAMLPVAGTFITQYNLAGPWTVRIALNGQVVGKDTFELLSRN